MMKTRQTRHNLLCAYALLVLVFSSSWSELTAQELSTQVSGKVTSTTGEELIGATVGVVGTSIGTITDLEGNFTINASGSDQLQISYIGYTSQTIAVNGQSTIHVVLTSDGLDLDELIVVGYGTQKKSDLTGSITTVGGKDFNKGVVSSPEQLLNGKAAGVQIVSSGGSPSSGSTIRIRGGASLNASNDPLIVLDGVPLEIGGISGNDGNFMAMINPADIESMTVLKDASSTAIYGSRASNGVLIINTKKGSGEKFKLNVQSTQSIQWKSKVADMLSYEQFVDVATAQGEAYSSLLGTARTDWNKEIFTPAFGTDNNVSINGRFAKNFPYRLSVGYYNQDGVLKTDNAQRVTGNISLNPSFFKDYLKLNLNVKGAYNTNQFAPNGAIWSAMTFNPTVPVYSGSEALGGFYEVVGSTGTPNPDAVKNPLGQIKQTDAQSEVWRVVGNLDLDYKMHFLPELRLHVTAGYDYAAGKGYTFIPETAAGAYDTQGYYAPYGTTRKENRLFTAYLNYSKEVPSIKSRFDATVGYDYQYWRYSSPEGDVYNANKESLNQAFNPKDLRHALLSYYGRFNYTYDSRYMLTLTVRRDGTSRFAPDHRWGTFPSAALAWRISEEAFLKDNKHLSNLKLRLSYGVTGQQDGIGDYNYLPVYYPGSSNGQYIGTNGEYKPTYLPSAYVSDLKWETTKSYNAGIDLGFLNNRINATIDYYNRKTEDLLATVPTAAGTNFNKMITTNVGNVASSGVEFSLNVVPIDTKDWTWDVNFNATWQQVNITNLTLVDNGEVTKTLVGPTIDDKYVQVMTEGRAPYTFFVYKQLYDESGRPLEGKYADVNADGKITIDDRYYYHSPAPDVLMGFSTSVRWKNLSLSTTLRASIGNYVYNAMAMNTGALETMKYSAPQLSNLSSSYLQTGFNTRQFYSDHYVENASFLKMDNLVLSYDFGRLGNDAVGLRLSLMMQNVFTLTKYSGVDPEISNGFDNSFYPRPRIVSLGIGLDL